VAGNTVWSPTAGDAPWLCERVSVKNYTQRLTVNLFNLYSIVREWIGRRVTDSVVEHHVQSQQLVRWVLGQQVQAVVVPVKDARPPLTLAAMTHPPPAPSVFTVLFIIPPLFVCVFLCFSLDSWAQCLLVSLESISCCSRRQSVQCALLISLLHQLLYVQPSLLSCSYVSLAERVFYEFHVFLFWANKTTTTTMMTVQSW